MTYAPGGGMPRTDVDRSEFLSLGARAFAETRVVTDGNGMLPLDVVLAPAGSVTVFPYLSEAYPTEHLALGASSPLAQALSAYVAAGGIAVIAASNDVSGGTD
eukprot:252505-Chlamydomonas_euryale.AAC.1